ncbi:hypothetical protein EGH21_10965 [Halomicroarcula sp. F13]|uniref:Glyoxylase-like metal-dependent hydrolase (Beta-lactamase superfamily II) n=1 Tax=Haloarcula rubra TaxID=2487747 RepID=A0AAW4PSM3_9EURY|nr:hypothetical protein [Halomicroarcula rubra]MBX0323550.1 hypothetical protein [Halomicroarcula rubra]
MPMKGSGSATGWEETNRWDRGASWLAYPEETMQRASHALDTDAGVVVVDPVDVDGIDDLFAEFDEVAGVAVLLDRHKRDSAAVANRHDVPVYVPEWMSGVASDLDADVERVRRQIPGTDYGVHKLVENPVWQEAALYGDDDDTLVVPEAVGTADYFLAGDERLGVHPMLRLTPPSRLERLDPDRLLVGHGHGIMADATEALTYALRGSRSRTPSLYAKNVKSLVFG